VACAACSRGQRRMGRSPILAADPTRCCFQCRCPLLYYRLLGLENAAIWFATGMGLLTAVALVAAVLQDSVWRALAFGFCIYGVGSMLASIGTAVLVLLDDQLAQNMVRLGRGNLIFGMQVLGPLVIAAATPLVYSLAVYLVSLLVWLFRVTLSLAVLAGLRPVPPCQAVLRHPGAPGRHPCRA
jgi:hypothetical protein